MSVSGTEFPKWKETLSYNARPPSPPPPSSPFPLKKKTQTKNMNLWAPKPPIPYFHQRLSPFTPPHDLILQMFLVFHQPEQPTSWCIPDVLAVPPHARLLHLHHWRTLDLKVSEGANAVHQADSLHKRGTLGKMWWNQGFCVFIYWYYGISVLSSGYVCKSI